jgi:hypothetical protein
LELTNIKEPEVFCSVYYHHTIKETGWDKLYVETSNEENSDLQLWSAGFLEGRMTHKMI